jgi:LmbE family N-acetylglucosaminyl deacetylase
MKLLFIFAHPDDETYGPAGTILHYVKKDAEIYLLTLTRGENGKLGICKTLPKPEVAELRTKELRCAVKVLGIKELIIGEFEDGTLSGISDEEGIAFIHTELQKIKPDAVITFHDEGITGHPDHIKVSKWVTEAVKERNSEVQLFYFGLSEEQTKKIIDREMYPIPNTEITHQLDVSDYLEQKKKAIECHDSQIEIFERMEKLEGGFEQLHRIESFSKIWPEEKIDSPKSRLI